MYPSPWRGNLAPTRHSIASVASAKCLTPEGRLHPDAVNEEAHPFQLTAVATSSLVVDLMQRNGVPIVRPLTSEPFTNYFCSVSVWVH
jgi:hypothetical protein